MGYITKDIAAITEPKIVSLAGSPNFVTFASKAAAKTYIDVDIKIVVTPATPSPATRSVLRVYEANGTLHEFHGTTIPAEVGGSVFFISTDVTDTAENLRQALIANAWLDANFEVRIASVWTGAAVANGSTINIKGKGAGADFRLNVTAPNNVANSAYVITWTSNTSTDGDTIKGNAATVEIELDVYENPAVFLGEDDRPTDENKLGEKSVTLQKTYAGSPVWFDLNGLFSKYGTYSLPSSVWSNTGTVKAFRFIAKVRAVNSFTFYQSNALFALNGFARLTDPVDLSEYVYGANVFKLLTNAPTLPYVKGQTAFLNFIYSGPRKGTYISARYTVLSRSGKYIASIQKHDVIDSSLAVANTLRLDIDSILGAYPTAGEVRVGLMQNGAAVSNELSFRILPECLHDLREFMFLNKLGGWDSFNFDATEKQDIKRSAENYYKTTTPNSAGGPEHVYSVEIDETYTVEGAPVRDEVAEWLKEFAASHAIFDTKGRQILIEDFTLSISPTAENMQVPTLKYRFNDTYTNE